MTHTYHKIPTNARKVVPKSTTVNKASKRKVFVISDNINVHRIHTAANFGEKYYNNNNVNGRKIWKTYQKNIQQIHYKRQLYL